MIKLSYIKKLPSGEYRVLSESGRNLGTYPSRQEAIERLKDVEMFKHMKRKKKASKGIDLSDIDSLSYSGVLRELRQVGSDEVVKDFLSVYHAAFKQLSMLGIENLSEKALEFVIKFLDNKYGINMPGKDVKKPLNQVSASRFAEVVRGIYRGGAPSEADIESMKENLGLKRVVSLDFDSANKIHDICEKLKIQHVVLPVQAKNFSVLKHFPKLDWASLLYDGGPSYIHCFHGKDRTGLAVALFRCQEGMPCSEAIKEADKFGFCVGLPKTVRAYYCGLLKEVCQHPEEHKDASMVNDLLWPEYLGDYKLNKEYLPEEPSFAIRLYPEDAMGNRPAETQDIPEYKVKDIPQVGLVENVSNVTTPGPAGIGTGYITSV